MSATSSREAHDLVVRFGPLPARYAPPAPSSAFSLSASSYSGGADRDRNVSSTNRSFMELFGVVILPSAVAERIHREAGSSGLLRPGSCQPTYTSSKIRVVPRTSASEEGPAENLGIWLRIGSATKGR
jgi:hypothetical protein